MFVGGINNQYKLQDIKKNLKSIEEAESIVELKNLEGKNQDEF